ncbi:MAG: beta-propeller domain-containing protein, partial [Pelobacteraceae bacterium]
MFKLHGRRSISTLCILFALTTLSACSSSGDNPLPVSQPVLSAKLVKPADSGALERWLKAELVKSYQYRDVRYYYATMSSVNTTGGTTGVPTYGSTTGTPPAPQTSGSGTADSYSSTNVQEQGVDEGDLVKNDGSYIYLARGSRFLILKGQPAEQAAVISDIDLRETISELHLAGTRVSIITAPYSAGIVAPATSPPIGASGGTGAAPAAGKSTALAGVMMPGVATTKVYNYDVSTPNAPALLSRFEFPGFLQGSRRINNTIYLITNHHIDLPSPVSAWDYMPSDTFSMEFYNQASAMASAENLRRIDALTLAEMIPSYSRTIYSGGVAGATSVSPVVASSDIYIPESGNGSDLSLVIAMDSAAADPVVTSSG